MAPDSRPPLSHLRPTLSTRLRRSFDGKRSKSEAAPPSSNGSPPGAGADPDALRIAVEQVLMGEPFQMAIAANLANIIKPSIKSALDTIQPVVEAVYSHDVLLRRTNKSVEQLLLKMETIPEVEDTHEVRPQQERSASAGSFYDMEFKALLEKSNKRTVANLAELSNAVQTNNSRIAGLDASFAETKERLEYLKALVQNEMDHLQHEVGRISEGMESQRKANGTTTSLFSAHANKLDLIASGLAGLKGYSELSGKLESVSGELIALRASVDAGLGSNNRGFVELGAKLDNVASALQTHGTTLTDIHQANSNSDILAAIQKSNASHDSHTLALGEIKERSIAEPAQSEARSIETASALSDLRLHVEALKGKFVFGQTTQNDSVSQIGSKMEHILSSLEGYKASNSSADILSALQRSNDSHDSHSSALDGLKTLLVVPTPSPNNNLAAVESQLSTILDTLSDLKSQVAAPSIPDESHSSEIPVITTTLATHTKLLKQIKDNVSAEILTVLHEIGQTQSSHSTALSEIREADVSDEILTALHTSNEAHNGHQAEFDKLHGAVRGLDEKHEKHGLELGEIKSRSLEAPVNTGQGSINDLDVKISSMVSTLEEMKSRSQETPPILVLDKSGGSDLEVKMTDIITHLEEQKSKLAAIQTSTDAAIDSHASHTSSLDDIKSRSLEPASAPSEPPILRDLEAKIIDIISVLEGQNVALATIKDSTHAAITSHTSSLEDIKAATVAQRELHDSHATALSEIKEAGVTSKELNTAHSATLADLVIATGIANDSHASHASILADLKALPAPPPPDLSAISALEADLKTILANLSTNTTILSELNSTSSKAHPDLVSSIQTSHDLLASHTSLLESIKTSSATSREELLARLASLKTALEDTKSDVNAHGTLVKDLHSETKDSHSSLTTAISSLALGGAAGAGAGLLLSRDNDEVSSEDLLQEVKAVKVLVEGGVWFSEKGLEQLKGTRFISVKEIEEDVSVNNEESVGEKQKSADIRDLEETADHGVITDQQPDFDLAAAPHIAEKPVIERSITPIEGAKEASVERSVEAIPEDVIPTALPVGSSIEDEDHGLQPLEELNRESAVDALHSDDKEAEPTTAAVPHADDIQTETQEETAKAPTTGIVPPQDTSSVPAALKEASLDPEDVSEAHLATEPELFTRSLEGSDDKVAVPTIAAEIKPVESPLIEAKETLKSDDIIDETAAEVTPEHSNIDTPAATLSGNDAVTPEAADLEHEPSREIVDEKEDDPVSLISAIKEEEKEVEKTLSPPVDEVIIGSSISNEKSGANTDTASGQDEDDGPTQISQKTISSVQEDDITPEITSAQAKQIDSEGDENGEAPNLKTSDILDEEILVGKALKDESSTPDIPPVNKEPTDSKIDDEGEPLDLSASPKAQNGESGNQATAPEDITPAILPTGSHLVDLEEDGSKEPSGSTPVAALKKSAALDENDKHEEATPTLSSVNGEFSKTIDDVEESAGTLASKPDLDDDDLEVEWSGKDDDVISAPLASTNEDVTVSNAVALEKPSLSESPLLSAPATSQDGDLGPEATEATVIKVVPEVTDSKEDPVKQDTIPTTDVFQYLDPPSSEDEKQLSSALQVSGKGKEVDVPSEDAPPPPPKSLEESEDSTSADLDAAHSQPKDAALVSPTTDSFAPTSEEGLASPKLPEQTDSEPATPVTPLTPTSSMKKSGSKKANKGKKGKKEKVRFEMDGEDP